MPASTKDHKPPLGGPERPIESASEDRLEREPFVTRIASALINRETGRATGIAVGITGPWGNGKSSILNLLRAHIKTAYPDAIVVSFDPWLVSGRNDLISEFINELLGTIKSEPKIAKRLIKLTDTITKYGSELAPLATLINPAAGFVVGPSLRLVRAARSRDTSLAAFRKRLLKELAECSFPIVVLIDELDRIEDSEIRIVAQLVRSVADFPGISYVLAFDHDRVIQALGEGVSEKLRADRGRSYLEKIVQIQIPLPVALDEEVVRLLTIELAALQKELGFSENFTSIERYKSLIAVLVPDVVQTLRDIKRLIGTFHVLGGMLRTEVDWVDLLAYSAMTIKAPSTIGKIRLNPDFFVEDALTVASMKAHSERSQAPLEQRLSQLIPNGEDLAETRQLVGFLFPSYSEDPKRRIEHSDALCLRRPLLTTLRLGLLPGGYSREAIQMLIDQPPEEIERSLREAYKNDTLSALTDRLDDLYVSLTKIDHVRLWKGVARFLRKPDCEWMTSYEPMHEVIRNFADILPHAISRMEVLRSVATTVFNNLMNTDEDVLTARWIRAHLSMYGLYGNEQRSAETAFLTAEQTEAQARHMSVALRPKHLSGELLPCRWDLQPVYIMIDMGLWDDLCRSRLDSVMEDVRALDGFTLMLFGSYFVTGREVIGKMFTSYDFYIDRVNARLASPTVADAHETVRLALEKAKKGFW